MQHAPHTQCFCFDLQRSAPYLEHFDCVEGCVPGFLDMLERKFHPLADGVHHFWYRRRFLAEILHRSEGVAAGGDLGPHSPSNILLIFEVLAFTQ
jgi:hypothetical protein